MLQEFALVCGVAALMLTCLGCGFGAARTRAVFDSTQQSVSLPDADWSGPAAEGPVQYHTARKGGVRMLPLKAWWSARRLRPPEGKVYALEIRYKDTVTKPVRCCAHGGLGANQSPTEVHRFGGTGDGEWKTAVVPVGWDQIMRLRDEPTMTAIGFEADADLPIASVTVRTATKADQRRYDAETRAWVAAVQADARRATDRQLEPRRFLPGQDLGGVVPFCWPTARTLRQNDQPADEQVGGAVKIRMCLNELQGGSFGVYANGTDLTNVDYKVSRLTGPAGTLEADVIRRTVEYTVTAGDKRGRAAGWLPQRLWPAYEVDIPKGASHWFLINIRTKRGQALPGTYRGKVTIAAKEGKATLPIEVEVLPVDLLTMEEAGLFMGGCTRGLLPVHDFNFAVDYNQNGNNVFFFGVKPTASMVDGKLQLDFAHLDEWMTSARKRGCKGVVWFLGGDPYVFPNTMTIFREMAAIDTRGGNVPLSQEDWTIKQSSEACRDRPMPAERELVVEWVRQVTTHAKRAGWPELILTPFDEPAKWTDPPGKKNSNAPGIIGAGPWIKPYFKDACAAIRQGDPDGKIYASIHSNSRPEQEGICFLEDIDVFCTNAIHEDPKMGEKVRAAGKTFWQYTGMGRGPRMEHSRYTFGFFFGAFGSVGSLCWAYNWGAGFDTSVGVSWMYAWHTPFDTIPSPFFEGLREAWDDRRIVETYKRRFAGDAEAMALLEGIFREAVAGRAPGGRDTVDDFYAAIDDPAKLDLWRNQLLDRLVKAGK